MSEANEGTPRTDLAESTALFQGCTRVNGAPVVHSCNITYVTADFARQLERELQSAKAAQERAEERLAAALEWAKKHSQIGQEMLERATAAEQRAAELEGALGRAVAIAEFWAPDEALVKPEEDRDWNLHIDQLQAVRALLTPKS